MHWLLVVNYEKMIGHYACWGEQVVVAGTKRLDTKYPEGTVYLKYVDCAECLLKASGGKGFVRD